MLPIKRTAFRELSTLHRELDEMFNRFFGKHERWWPALGWEEGRFPLIDYVRKDDNLVVRAELPGIDPKDIDVDVTGNQLRIRGERKAEKELDEKNYYLHEISCGTFERTMTLPEGVNTDQVQASYRNGILEITMPAKGLPKPRQIEISTEKETKRVKAA